MVERTITTTSIAARTRTVNFWTFVSRDSKVNRSTPFDGSRCNHIRQVFRVMSVSDGDSLRESRLFVRGRRIGLDVVREVVANFEFDEFGGFGTLGFVDE